MIYRSNYGICERFLRTFTVIAEMKINVTNPSDFASNRCRVVYLPRTPKIAEKWMPEAAELVVFEGITLKEAVTQLGVPLTTDECLLIARRKGFKDLVRQVKNRLHNEVGSDPARTKDALVGQMLILADNLDKAGESEKAADVLFKVAKVKNWIGPESNINIFGDLSQKDLDEMRKRIKEGVDGTITPN